MTQPATSEVPVWAYPQAENHCPAGLVPVRVGGVVSCGTPTRHGYGTWPERAHGKTAAGYTAYSKSPGGNGE